MWRADGKTAGWAAGTVCPDGAGRVRPAAEMGSLFSQARSRRSTFTAAQPPIGSVASQRPIAPGAPDTVARTAA
jgi:hypothetical protein